jgi:hypothetical protein
MMFLDYEEPSAGAISLNFLLINLAISLHATILKTKRAIG